MPGRLVVICGPMFAGKSTELMARVEGARKAGRDVCVIKPAWDDRYDAKSVVTHDGRSLEAEAVADAAEMQRAASQARQGDVVAIDEAHFFGAGLVGPVLELVARGVEVVVVGVERDHRGAPFEPFPRLLVEADEVVKRAARCAKCGGEAVHSQRMVKDDGHIVVGGADAYEARCRGCFEPGC